MCEPIEGLVVPKQEVHSWDVLHSLLALLKVGFHMLKNKIAQGNAFLKVASHMLKAKLMGIYKNIFLALLKVLKTK